MPPDTDSESSDSESDSETESSRYDHKDLQNCGLKTWHQSAHNYSISRVSE